MVIVENFGDYFRIGWVFGLCGNDVVIFYVEDLNKVYCIIVVLVLYFLNMFYLSLRVWFIYDFKVYVVVGYKVNSFVIFDVIDYIKMIFVFYKNNGRLVEGFFVIVEKLCIILCGVMFVYIFLILNMIVVVLIVVFLIFFFYFWFVEFNVWGCEGFWKILEYFFYLIFGVWMINGFLFGVIYMFNKVLYWVIFFFGIIGLVCIVMYIFEEKIFDIYFDSGFYMFNIIL